MSEVVGGARGAGLGGAGLSGAASESGGLSGAVGLSSAGLRAALVRGVALFGCSALLGCAALTGGMFGGSEQPASQPGTGLAPSDPTPLGRCKIAASASSPLVTEWPASEKAHLESLSVSQTVAVQFSGCEMRIIDGCRLPGHYAWRRTTLSTDTVEITNADDLYAKLPLGALSLEGELERSGRLAVRTTVAGQLRLEGLETANANTPDCSEATHVVSAISVGAFKMLSGGALRAGGGGSTLGVGASVSTRQSESVMRESGVQDACGAASAEAPDPQCGAPIQLFLSPLRRATDAAPDPAALQEQIAKQAGGVQVSFDAPEDGERWTLRNAAGDLLCDLPCQRWIGQSSGYYLQRERGPKTEVASVQVPGAVPFSPGSSASASYRAERGSPYWSSLTFYFAGIPSAAMGSVFLGFGLEQAISGRDCDGIRDCPLFGSAGGNIGFSLFYFAMAGGAAYWYLWSHDEEVDFRKPGEQARTSVPQGVYEIGLSPSGVSGRFW